VKAKEKQTQVMEFIYGTAEVSRLKTIKSLIIVTEFILSSSGMEKSSTTTVKEIFDTGFTLCFPIAVNTQTTLLKTTVLVLQ